MSSEIQLSLPAKNRPGIIFKDSAMVPGVMCHLALRAPITAQPSAEELALISGLLPELIGQLLADPDVEFKE